jgi:putative restriction endonuclease
MVNPIQYQRAANAWPLLTETAASQSKITYADLAQQLGIHPRPIRYVLGVIQDYCLREKLPPLTILVVSRRGVPSEGFIAWDVDDLAEGYRLAYGYPWHELPNPFGFAESGTTLEQLAQRLLSKPEESTEVYGRIQNRGMAQVLFRLTLLSAYGWRCAFCGLSLQEALQAAHIIRWSEATIAQRLDPRNGLLLCATHHALFDAHVLTLTADRRIAFRPQRAAAHSWTEADQQAAVSLDGKRIRTPLNPNLLPSEETIHHRAEGLTGSKS